MGFRKPFRAVPLKGRDGRTIPFRKPRKGTLLFDEYKGELMLERKRRKGRERVNWWAVIIAFGSVVLIGLGLSIRYGAIDIDRIGQPEPVVALPVAGPQDTLSATFSRCTTGKRRNCIVDGDTFWFHGEKYRILDINTPEISTPRCDRELQLGQAASRRLRQLLNAGPFSLETGPELTDRYGRNLRRVMRGGQSLGDVLVAEGLAEEWQGFRRSWC